MWDTASGIARADIAVAERIDDGTLVRSDLALTQKCYSESEVLHALKAAGFSEITVDDGARDLGYGGLGRAFSVAS